jgi:tartrate/fumarate subfamily iron-sulfur-dependent hydro-lyase beta chain
MISNLTIPLTDDDLNSLHVGDIVSLSGTVFTARDEAHQRLLSLDKKKIPFDIQSMGLYHCGPLMEKKQGKWRVISAGPTTSSRMDLFEQEFIQKFHTNTIIGKGMMGEKTRIALKEKGVFFVYTGGVGALAADQITSVKNVYWLEELGMAEAVWIFTIDHFGPVVVAIDAYGNSMFHKK